MADKTSLAGAAIAASCGLGGVMLGAYISGHYQLESQRIAAQQSENVQRYESSRALGQELAKNAGEYFTEVTYLATFAKTPGQIKDLDERMRALQQAAFKLSLMTTLPTAQKIFEANVYVAELLKAAGDPAALKTLEPKSNVLGELYISLYSDVARFRWNAGPTTGRDELLTSVLQLLAQGSTKKR